MVLATGLSATPRDETALVRSAVGRCRETPGHGRAEVDPTADILGILMRAVVYDRYGSPEVLRVAEVPIPKPAAGQVRVEVTATSVNLSDWECLRGSPMYA